MEGSLELARSTYTWVYMTDLPGVLTGRIHMRGPWVEKLGMALSIRALWTEAQKESQAMLFEARIAGTK